jgi:hypothetical protein
MIVLDAHSSGWMSAWREKFQSLQIDHLRSPLFFHPDPRDRDGLLAFAHFNQRSEELEEIQNVVGKEISKHRAKQNRRMKYNAPPVFSGFIEADYRSKEGDSTPSD